MAVAEALHPHRSPARLRLAFALGIVLVLVTGAWTTPAGAAPPACTGFTQGTEVGRVTDPAVVELSGIAASRAHPGVLWVHNDSGGAPELEALTGTGAALGHYPIEGASATDWEDIGIGPGPGAERPRAYLYIGDIGDNNAQRDHVTVYVVAEPDAAPDGRGATLPVAETLTIHYPDGPANAESLFVDPLTGDLYIVTKVTFGRSRVLRADAATVARGGDITMQDVGGFQVRNLVTAADISPDGSTILVRTYASVLAFRRARGASVASAFVTRPCTAPSIQERQGEAVAFSADGAAYYTSSEGDGPPIHRFGVDPPLQPNTTTTTTPSAPSTATTTPAADPADSDDGVVPTGLIVAGVAVAAAAIVAVGALVRRGRSTG